MRARISASDLGRELPSILEGVSQRGDSFEIEQDGEVVAVLQRPPAPATWSTLADALRAAPMPDEAFADDLEAIQQNQPQIAATALSHDYEVTTYNVRDFGRVPGLEVQELRPII